MSDTTVSVDDDAADDAPESSDLALVIAWSAEQPTRVGESARFGAREGTRVFGRGAEGEGAVVFARERPGERTPGPPLEGAGLSRRQLGLRPRAGVLLCERLGKCPVLVRGEPIERTALSPGDVVVLKGQLVLLCVLRPPMPARGAHASRFGEADAHGIVGESSAIWRLREQLAFSASAPGHALVTGPSGTGKELAARAIHALSERARGPFVSRSAATFPGELVDAELFGNMRGYPTAGLPLRIGLFGEADGGTLLLDELGDLPIAAQAHLLRALDAGEYHRLGESAARRANVRIVGATNRPLEALRPELRARFRLRVETPALADRREDVPLLLRHLLRRAAADHPRLLSPFLTSAGEPRVDPWLIEHLLLCALPGNVRDLEALLWAAVESSKGSHVRLTERVRGVLGAPAGAALEAEDQASREPTHEEIRRAVAQHAGNLSRVAGALGLGSRFALYRLLKKRGIELGPLRGGTG